MIFIEKEMFENNHLCIFVCYNSVFPLHHHRNLYRHA